MITFFIKKNEEMSLLKHYAAKRNSSLTLFNPVTSPIHHLFKKNNSLRYATLKPLDDLKPVDESNKDKPQNETETKDNKKSDGKNNGKDDGKKKKKEEIEPICDLELTPGFNAQNKKKVHSKIELPSLPPLPGSPGNSNFTSILQKKINLILVDLDFTDAEGDVAAKEIRLNALNEINNVVSNQQTCDKLSKEDQDILYSGIKQIIFKDLLPVRAQFLFCDDLVVLSDSAWDHTKVAYQILQSFVLWSLQPNSKCTIKLNKGENLEDLLKLLFRQFNKYDLAERNTISDIICQMIAKDSNNITQPVLQKCCSMVSNYLDGGTQPYILLPTVAIFNYIFKFGTPLEKTANGKGDKDQQQNSPPSFTTANNNNNGNNGTTPTDKNVVKYEEIYFKYILPLLGAVHFPICSDSMYSIVDQFVKGNPKLVMPTISELVKHFPITRSVKTISFLKMLTNAMTKINVRDFKKNMKLLFHLFVKCTVGPQVKVSDASLGIWHKIELEPLIMDNAKIIFPFVYPILSKGMRENWSQDIINNIDDIFQTMNRIDSFIFQELCRQKPSQNVNVNTNDHLKTWAIIARAAAKSDRNLNLATKLAEIQRVFAIQQQAPTNQINPPKNKSSTNLATNAPLGGMQRNSSRASTSFAAPLPPFKSS